MTEEDDETVFLGTEFTKILENVVADGRAVQKRGNIAHLTSTGGKGKNAYERRQAARLHGAFTGGFSAGYFNTVGSVEGWSTAAFKSSRSSRNEGGKQRPEDFMDEEDFGEFGIAPKSIKVSKTFASSASTSASIDSFFDERLFATGPTSSTSKSATNSFAQGTRDLFGIVKTANQSFGARLLRLHLHKHIKLLQSDDAVSEDFSAKVYGCALPSDVRESYLQKAEREDKDAVAVKQFLELAFPQNFGTGAEDQARPLTHFGLGYKGLSLKPATAKVSATEQSALTTIGDRFSKQRKSKKGISGQAFGIGVGDDENEDEYSNIMNFYGHDDKSGYDFAIGPEKDDQEVILSLAEQTAEMFVSSQSQRMSRKHFRPPTLPKDFVVMHKPSAAELVDAAVYRAAEKKPDRLNVLQRAEKLGELYPVTALLSDKQRNNLKPSRTEVPKKSEPSHLQDVASAREMQQKEKGTELSKVKKEVLYTRGSEGSDVLDWDRQRGMDTLKKTHLYQPMLAQIQSRFQSTKSEEESKTEEKEPENVKLDAVKAKKFGKLTRCNFEWHPDRILCKRMNVPNPYPESELVGVVDSNATNKSTASVKATSNLVLLTANPTQDEMRSRSEDVRGGGKEKSLNKAELPSGSSTGFDKTAEMYKPICKEVDLFASIFESSSEESSDDDDGDKKKSVESQQQVRTTSRWNREPSPKAQPSTSTEDHQHHDRPERGRDSIPWKRRHSPVHKSRNNDSRRSPNVEVLESESVSTVPLKTVQKAEEDSSYGPALPPPELFETLKNDTSFLDYLQKSDHKKRKHSSSTKHKHKSRRDSDDQKHYKHKKHKRKKSRS